MSTGSESESKLRGGNPPAAALTETRQERGRRVTRAIVFTDIVGSTPLARELGDHEWNEILKAHIDRARLLLKSGNGLESKFTGDGFLMTFDAVEDALDFCMEFGANPGDSRIRIRAGIHIGPVNRVENDVVGQAVNFAARVCNVIERDEIWISEEVKKDLKSGGHKRHIGLVWIPKRKTELKGFSGKFTLWSLKKTGYAQMVSPGGQIAPPSNLSWIQAVSVGVIVLAFLVLLFGIIYFGKLTEMFASSRYIKATVASPPINTNVNTEQISNREIITIATANTRTKGDIRMTNLTEWLAAQSALAANAGTFDATTHPLEAGFVDIQLGENGAVFRLPEGTSILEVLLLGLTAHDEKYADLVHKNKVFAKIRDERLYVSTRLTTPSGLLVEILDNEWKVRPERFDRNYSPTALEVKDANGKIVLKLVLKGDRVLLEGIFQTSSETAVLLKNQPGGGSRLSWTSSERPFFEESIEPYFRYPSELHLGELAKPENR